VSTSQRFPTLAPVTEDDVLDLLRRGDLELEGRLVLASNATFVGSVSLDGVSLDCVYKPVRGERPLWDFPGGTLAAREVAAYEVSVASGWSVVPPTVLRDGPFGPGMCQQWIEVDAERDLIDIVPADDVGDGWLRVLDAEDQTGHPVSLVHADIPALRRMAVFDAVVNNADRKGGHVLPTATDAALGVDHGVCFHVDDKLRTVLWGWAGSALPAELVDGLHRLAGLVAEGDLAARLAELLSRRERRALLDRITLLRSTRRFPLPPPGWPAIPWPAF
jgi:uncharacterized repeat protein (TIGR03843 family)